MANIGAVDLTDLSDAELRARLTQRDVSPEVADVLVEARDDEGAAELIGHILDGTTHPDPEAFEPVAHDDDDV